MATAKRIDPEPQPLPPPSYQLTLSEDEARTLLQLVGIIGGTPEGPRKYTSAIYDALYRLELKPAKHLIKADGREFGGLTLSSGDPRGNS